MANLLGTPVSYAYAVKSGPWIFLTEAFDFESGIPEEVAGPSGSPCSGGRAPDARAISSCNECGASCASSGPISAAPCASTSIIRPGRGRSLSPRATCRIRRLHSSEHFGGDGALFRRRGRDLWRRLSLRHQMGAIRRRQVLLPQCLQTRARSRSRRLCQCLPRLRPNVWTIRAVIFMRRQGRSP
jgi:hypothetical protein